VGQLQVGHRLLGSIRKGGLFNKGNCHIFFRNIFRNGHKKFLFLTLVPRKIFFITIIEKTIWLEFIHFILVNFRTLRGVAGGLGLVGRGRGTKDGFFVLGKNLLGLFGTFSSLQPSLRVIHENLGSYFIL
jgi:hypothetical protein